MAEAGQPRSLLRSGTGNIATLVAVTHHAGSSVTPGTYYTHHNHRGDVIITRSGTTTVGTYEYAAFGNLKSSIGNDVCRFKFSSKELDRATGFYYYGYRFYAPQWQRWVSRDPIGENGGFNLYGFVKNSPMCYYDLLGLILGRIPSFLSEFICPYLSYNLCRFCCAVAFQAALLIDMGEGAGIITGGCAIGPIAVPVGVGAVCVGALDLIISHALNIKGFIDCLSECKPTPESKDKDKGCPTQCPPKPDHPSNNVGDNRCSR